MGIGIVKTKFGKMSGVESSGDFSGITLFKGIPYAKPPVGELRWKAPEDPESWSDIRVCDKFGDAPVQNFDIPRYAEEFYSYVKLPPVSEDCLYLNICTGAQSAEEKRPVFMWFHGGGFTDCYSYEKQFNPEVLAKKGIVVVTVGIRVGVFGYLALPQLSREQGGHSGNYGLMDLLRALDWVYENISAFGGDPENITVGGQSGGCTRAETLATIPASKGRIKRVISQSGLRWYYKFTEQEKMEQQGMEYLEKAGIDPNTPLEELRAMDTFEIFDRNIDRFEMPGGLVYDGALIPQATLPECFEEGAAGIDFLNGCNLGEAVVFANSFSGLSGEPVMKFEKKTIDCAKDFYDHFKKLLGPLYEKYDFENLVKVTDENAWYTARALAAYGLAGRGGPNYSRNIMLDRKFGRYMAKLSGNTSKVYTYLWSHMQPLVESKKGTEIDMEISMPFHTSEFWFTFASLREGVPPHRPWRELDYEFADKVSSYWANFIRNGDPNGENLPEWPETGTQLGYMELNPDLKAHVGLENKLDELCYEFVTLECQLED